MKAQMVESTKLKIDVSPNKPEIVSQGGPKYIGFEFFIRKEQSANMCDYADKVLKAYKIKYIKMECVGNVLMSEDKLATKKTMLDEVERKATEVKGIQKMRYKPVRLVYTSKK